MAGALRTFTGQDLFNQIDGGAELFLEFGFATLRLQAYARDKSELTLGAYEMESAAAALGVYLMKMGRETPFPEIAARNSGEEAQVTIVKGRYFVQVDNLGDVPASKAEAAALANAFLAGVAAESAPTPLDALPAEGKVPGSERLIRGPYGLQPYFTFGEGDILSLGGRVFGALANYRMPDGASFDRLIVPYPDAGCVRRGPGPSQGQPRHLHQGHGGPPRRLRFRRLSIQERLRGEVRRRPGHPLQRRGLGYRGRRVNRSAGVGTYRRAADLLGAKRPLRQSLQSRLNSPRRYRGTPRPPAFRVSRISERQRAGSTRAVVQISDNLTTSSPVSAQNHRSHSPHSMSRPGRLGPRPEAVSPTRLIWGFQQKGQLRFMASSCLPGKAKACPICPREGTWPPAIGSRRRSPKPGRP